MNDPRIPESLRQHFKVWNWPEPEFLAEKDGFFLLAHLNLERGHAAQVAVPKDPRYHGPANRWHTYSVPAHRLAGLVGIPAPPEVREYFSHLLQLMEP